MRGHFGIALPPLMILLACLIGCEKAQTPQSQSVPLRPTMVDSLGLSGGPIWFSDQIVGRHATKPAGWIAVERVSFRVGNDPKLRTFAAMESLAASGALTDTTPVAVVHERTLLRGDSLAAAALLATGRAQWRTQSDDEPSPADTIYPVNAMCRMVEPDKIQ